MQGGVKRLFRAGLLVGLFLLASGCASTGTSQCTSPNWERLGFQDGEEGRPASWIEKHQDKCAGEGRLANLALYQRGHQQGIKAYCTPTSGYRVGSFDRSYQNVCPSDLEPAFLGGVRIGKQVFAIRQRRSDIENRLASIRAMRAKPSLSTSEAARLIQESQQLEAQREQLEVELNRIKIEAKAYIEDHRLQ